jgi:hypothetical protein
MGAESVKRQAAKMRYKTKREDCDYILEADGEYAGMWCSDTKVCAFQGHDYGKVKTWKEAREILKSSIAEEVLVDRYRESLR